jgi:hypothetical protein
MNKPLWHRPRIVTVEDVGPFRAYKLFTLIDGRRLIVRDTPSVVNSGDAKRKARKTKQASLATRACRARKKKRNPVTKRIDPVSVLKAPLPYSVLREIDAAWPCRWVISPSPSARARPDEVIDAQGLGLIHNKPDDFVLRHRVALSYSGGKRQQIERQYSLWHLT